MMSLLQNQVTHRLLHSIDTCEPRAQSPLVFLDLGDGEKEFRDRLFEKYSFDSYTLCSPFCLPQGVPDFLHHVILDKTHLPFAATFDVIVARWITCLPLAPEQLLRQLMGCLKPGGRLYLVALGEFSFYEWFYACQQAEIPLSFPAFLNQRQPLWPENHQGALQEEWIELSFPRLDQLLAFLDPYGGDYPSPVLAEREKAFDFFSQETKGRLTLHLFYAQYVKPQTLREE